MRNETLHGIRISGTAAERFLGSTIDIGGPLCQVRDGIATAGFRLAEVRIETPLEGVLGRVAALLPALLSTYPYLGLGPSVLVAVPTHEIATARAALQAPGVEVVESWNQAIMGTRAHVVIAVGALEPDWVREVIARMRSDGVYLRFAG